MLFSVRFLLGSIWVLVYFVRSQPGCHHNPTGPSVGEWPWCLEIWERFQVPFTQLLWEVHQNLEGSWDGPFPRCHDVFFVQDHMCLKERKWTQRSLGWRAESLYPEWQLAYNEWHIHTPSDVVLMCVTPDLVKICEPAAASKSATICNHENYLDVNFRVWRI
jgi:hypothetical protein